MAAAIVAPILAGCAGSGLIYSPPGPGEAQAVVEVRTRYAPLPWHRLHERVEIDGARVDGPSPAASGGARRLAVRAGIARWAIDSGLYVVRTEIQQQIAAHTFMCGPNGVTCTHAFPVQVPVQVDVPVAQCHASLAQSVVDGERYVLQFDLVGHGQCQLACYRGRPGGALEPCPPATAPR